MTQLSADYLTLATFLDALFRYADDGTYVSWRAFRDDTKDAPPVFIESSQLEDGPAPLAAIADAAVLQATRAAQHPFPAVFCPPIATFTSATRAREIDLANGLALSVECDASPATARATLEQLLGPATVVVSSGGVTPNGEPKLHLHWRLAEPTTDVASHTQLKRARILATAIVGGDATNVPAVHPIRWPGSWHRKAEPTLSKIVAVDLERELTLSDALERLEAAAGTRPATGGSPLHPFGEPVGISHTAALVQELLSGRAMHAPLVALAYRYLKGGMVDAQCVLTLRGLMDAIPDAVRGGVERWRGHYNDLSRTVRTAREKIGIDGSPATERPDVSEFLSAQHRPSAPAIIAQRAPEIQEIPAALLAPPGVLADIARYGIESAVRPVPIFAVQAALALGSVVCSRRYMTSQRNYSSLYFLNIAKSGTGKEEAKTTIERVLAAAGARRLIGGSSYSSGNAVFSALLRKPQHLTIVDEFGKYLEAATGTRDAFKSDALTQLMEAFGRVHGDWVTPQFSTMTLSPTAASTHEPKTIARPAITLLAMTTPSTFFESMRSSRILDGFLNRFLIVEHQGPRTPMVEWRDVAVPELAVNWVQQMLQPLGNLDSGMLAENIPDPVLVPLTGASFEASRHFETEMLTLASRLESEGLGDMPIRAREIALRLALIVALADTPDTPIVTVDCFDWAASYVRFFLNQTLASLRTSVADTATGRIRNVVLNAVRQAGPRGVSNKELHRGRMFVGIPRRERQEAIESLEAAELIAWADIPQPARGRPRRALVAIDDQSCESEAELVHSPPNLMAS